MEKKIVPRVNMVRLFGSDQLVNLPKQYFWIRLCSLACGFPQKLFWIVSAFACLVLNWLGFGLTVRSDAAVWYGNCNKIMNDFYFSMVGQTNQHRFLYGWVCLGLQLLLGVGDRDRNGPDTNYSISMMHSVGHYDSYYQ